MYVLLMYTAHIHTYTCVQQIYCHTIYIQGMAKEVAQYREQ